MSAQQFYNPYTAHQQPGTYPPHHNQPPYPQQHFQPQPTGPPGYPGPPPSGYPDASASNPYLSPGPQPNSSYARPSTPVYNGLSPGSGPGLPDPASLNHLPPFIGESHVEILYMIATLPEESRSCELKLIIDGKEKVSELITHYSSEKKREFKKKFSTPKKIQPGSIIEVKCKWYKGTMSDSKKAPGPTPSFVFHDIRQLIFSNLKEVLLQGEPQIAFGLRVTLGFDSDAKKLKEAEQGEVVGAIGEAIGAVLGGK